MADTDKPSVGTYTVTVSGEGVSVERTLDGDAALEVIALVVGGARPSTPSQSPARRRRRQPEDSKGESGSPQKARRRRSGSASVVKDLSMRPSGKKAFQAFAEEKAPKTHQQRQAVSLHWLIHEAGISDGITTDHLNTCYLEAGWTRPANLENSLQVTAVRQGWFDTGDMANIKLTTRGEDFVAHELPAKGKKS